MKNKVLGIIALIAIIGFSMAACSSDPDPDPDPDLPGTITVSPSTGVTTGMELTATYSGTETVSYQWKNGATNVGTNSNKFTPTAAGSYTVTVSATGFNSKTSAAVTVTAPIELKNGAIELTAGQWTDGNLPSDTDEKWFTFVATGNTQNIFFLTGTLKVADSQVYEDDATTENGTSPWLLGSTTISQTATNNINYVSGKRYYIKIFGLPTATENYGNTSGTFKIAFSSDTSPAITVPSSGVTQLTIDTPADGNMPQLGEQWFKFTANTNKVFLKFNPATSSVLTFMGIQLYDPSGNAVGQSISVSPSAITALTVTSGREYYFRASGGLFFSGTYKISVNTSFTTGAPTNLTIESWSNSVNIENIGDEVWFKFTATDMTRAFIHFAPGTVTRAYVDLFDADGNAVGDLSNFIATFFAKGFISRTVTSGNVYYIRVKGDTPSSSESDTSGYTGTFKIAASKSFISDNTGNSFGTSLATQLTVGSWSTNGNIATAGDNQWFKFTATAATHYIHYTDKGKVNTLTLDGANVYLFDATGTNVGTSQFMGGTYGKDNFSQAVTSGSVYYIKVEAFSSSKTGTYKIAFNTSATAPSGE